MKEIKTANTMDQRNRERGEKSAHLSICHCSLNKNNGTMTTNGLINLQAQPLGLPQIQADI